MKTLQFAVLSERSYSTNLQVLKPRILEDFLR
jgi:hypothetical protein